MNNEKTIVLDGETNLIRENPQEQSVASSELAQTGNPTPDAQTKKENKPFLNKFKGIWEFILKYYGYFLIPLFVFAVFGASYIHFDVWPFGDAMISNYDLLAQIAPFIEHFFDVLDGTSGLFHTFHIGGGMDMFGSLAYCVISPFTPLFLLGEQGNVIFMVSIVLPLKFACVGLAGFYFVRKLFGSIPQYIAICLALLYAFSGYVYVANTYIIWLDIMIYLPFFGLGIVEFVKTGKVKKFAIFLALMIYASFSITCFSLFTLFPILIAYVLICKQKEEYKFFLSRLCLGFVLAVAIAMPVLLPSLVAYTQSGRNTGLFSRVFEILTEEKIKNGDLTLHIYEKFTYILCDSTLIFLTFIYFFRSKVGDKFARWALVAFILLLLPCLVDESMLLLNMGSYYSYALRFGFLWSFFLLLVASKGISQYIEDKKEGKPISQNKTTASAFIMTILTVVGVLFTFSFFRFIANGDYKENPLVDKIFGTGEDLHPFEDFFALFAHSEGGLEGTAVLFIIVIIIFIISALLLKFKLCKWSDIACFLCILSLSQTVFFNFAMVKGNRLVTSAKKFDYYKEMAEDIEDEEYYRIKSYGYYISSDSPITTQTYAHSVFSSMVDAKNLTAPVLFKYGGSGTNSTRTTYGGMFSDALLSYKYVVYEPKDKSSATNKDYLTATDVYAYPQPNLKVYSVEDNTATPKQTISLKKENYGKGKWIKLKLTIKGNKMTAYLGGEKVYSQAVKGNEILSIEGLSYNVNGQIRNLSVSANGKKVENQEWQKSSETTFENGIYATENAKANVVYKGESDGVTSVEAEVLYNYSTDDYDYIGVQFKVKNFTGDENTVYRLAIEPNMNTVKTNAVYMVYKNELSLPTASIIDERGVSFDGLNYVEKIDEVYKLLSGGESGYEVLPFKSISSNDDGSYTVKFETLANSDSYFYYEFPEGYEVTGATDGYKRYGYTSGKATRAVTLRRTNGVLTKEEIETYCKAVSMTGTAVSKLKDKLTPLDYKLEKNKIVFEPFTAEKGKYLYLNYVALDGYKAFVNGKEVKMIENDIDFMLVPLEEGENEVEIVYTSPYYKFILLGIILGGLIIGICWLIYKKKTKIFETLSLPISIVGVALAVGLILFFFIFPIGIFGYKFFFKYFKILF